MATQTREQGRYLGGRPPYGCRLADAGPHPNKAHAAWGRRAHRLEPDPVTAPVVRWMFAQRLAGHSVARITRALNDAGIPCPSAADPGRNPHRSGAGWTLRTVAAILANPRYTGRQVWNRQRTDFDLVDPANTGLGHKQVQRWNLPEGWVISKHPAHPALVSEADFVAAQDTTAPRGPAGPAVRRYLLAGLLACGTCGRRLESAWSNSKPAYRCRHGYTSATRPEPGRPKNTYVREDQILPHLAAAAILLARGSQRNGDGTRHLTTPTHLADLLGMGRLPEAWIAPAELREFTRHRQRLVGLRTSYKDQVDAVLAKLGIPVTCPGIFGTAGDQPGEQGLRGAVADGGLVVSGQAVIGVQGGGEGRRDAVVIGGVGRRRWPDREARRSWRTPPCYRERSAPRPRTRNAPRQPEPDQR